MSLMTIDKKTSDKSMSNFETLRETKVAYNYIDDILQNSEIRMDTETVGELKNAMDILNDLYSVTYSNLSNPNRKEQLITDACCKNCNTNLLISDNIEYSYQCEKCDENFYDFEAIADNVWYQDKMKSHIELNDDFYLQVAFSKDKKLAYIGTENSSGVKYTCENMDELLKNIEMYCDNYLCEEKEEEVVL